MKERTGEKEWTDEARQGEGRSGLKDSSLLLHNSSEVAWLPVELTGSEASAVVLVSHTHTYTHTQIGDHKP